MKETVGLQKIQAAWQKRGFSFGIWNSVRNLGRTPSHWYYGYKIH